MIEGCRLSSRTRLLVVATATAVAGSALGWWWFRAAVRSGPVFSEHTRAVAEQAARTLAELQAFEPMSDPTAVRRCFDAADIHGPSEITSRDLDGVRDVAADFVTSRLARGASPAAYAQKRLQTGYRLNSDEVLDRVWEVNKLFALRENREPPGDRIESFKILARNDLDQAGAANRPVRIASDGKGVIVMFGELERSNPVFEQIEGYFPREVWHGAVSTTHLPFFVPPASREEILAEHGKARYCRVGFIVESEGGQRYPMVLTLVLDPKRSEWFILHVNVNNTTSTPPLMLH